jgi:transcriptional regulator with XRE-family HTH domain
MLTIEQIKDRLSDRNLAEVARRVGVTRAYLSAITNDRVKPSYDMLVKLSDYLEAR